MFGLWVRCFNHYRPQTIDMKPIILFYFYENALKFTYSNVEFKIFPDITLDSSLKGKEGEGRGKVKDWRIITEVCVIACTNLHTIPIYTYLCRCYKVEGRDCKLLYLVNAHHKLVSKYVCHTSENCDEVKGVPRILKVVLQTNNHSTNIHTTAYLYNHGIYSLTFLL